MQRNAYKGSPERAWNRVQIVALDGTLWDGDFLVDTGNPFAIVLDSARMRQLKQLDAPPLISNFGTLEGGWVQVRIPATRIDQLLLGYGSDTVAAACQRSSADFAGLAGLPLLRLAEYGGDAGAFWLRTAGQSP
ncbi:MAG: hypothetical protein JNM56_10825 [Planctomycetia bacterium]|nr:hypothetical protein [Planctomycetia bacterium]